MKRRYRHIIPSTEADGIRSVFECESAGQGHNIRLVGSASGRPVHWSLGLVMSRTARLRSRPIAQFTSS